MGRQTLLTPALQVAICGDIREGSTYKIAAECNGVTEQTLFVWIRKGKDGLEPYAAFAEAIERARAEFKQEALREIRQAALPSGMPDWKARAWILEKTDPEQFAPMTAINLKVEKELSAGIERLRRAGLSPEALELALSALTGNDESGPDENDSTQGGDTVDGGSEGAGRPASAKASG